jgi:hypothetical protein
MRQHDLLSAYEQGSAIALHVRFASAIRGFRHIAGGVPTLLDAEMDPYELSDYHAVVARFLLMQQKVFRALDPLYHERDLELPRLTRQAFDRHVEAVVAQITNRYPDIRL